MSYDPKKSWEEDIVKSRDVYPAQGLIRMLRGQYPGLTPFKKSGDALDSGCGDGRNSIFLRDEGFEVTGLEISQTICDNLSSKNPGIDFRVGESSNLPFSDNTFDLSVSWHAIYYVSLGAQDVARNFREIFRVTKKEKDSRFIVSVPMPTSFIYEESELIEMINGIEYRRIRKDPFDIRNGEVLGCFPNLEVLIDTMVGAGFKNLQIGEEKGFWFGHQNDWWVVAANLI